VILSKCCAHEQPDEDSPASPSSGPRTPEQPQSPEMDGVVSPQSPGSPGSGTKGMPWRRGHSRQTSLGTTNTSSPSMRRRSLENTMHLIRDVVDGRDANGDVQLERLAEVISSPSRTKPADGLA